jgi:hypothetical protein
MTEQNGKLVFRPRSTTTSIVLLSILMLVFIAVMAILSKAVAVILGLATVGVAAWLIVSNKRISIEMDSRGITQHRRSSSSTMAWDEISHYRFWSSKQQSGAGYGAGGLIGVLVVAAVNAARSSGKDPNRSFQLGFLRLFGNSGTAPISITPNYAESVDMLERAFAELHPRLAARPTFGDFALQPQLLRHKKKGDIAFADIEHISIAGYNLSVKKRDKRLMWASSQMSKVDNSMLLLEQLAAAGVVVKASSEVFVPQPVLNLFQQVAARHAALPQARVVQR